MLNIIKASTSSLNKHIKSWAKRQAKVLVDGHVLACSVLAHAMQHGDVRPLNLFYDCQTVNMQTALRIWIGHATKVGKTGDVLDFTDKAFHILPGTPKERKAMLKLVTEKLINPDGEVFKLYFERNIVKELALYTDVEFAAELKRLYKKATTDSETRHSKVNSNLLAALGNVVNLAEVRAANVKAA
jgi:hypothetical protein